MSTKPRQCEMANCDKTATTQTTYDHQSEELGFDSEEGCWKIATHFRKADLCDDHVAQMRAAYGDLTETPI
jgi:hypothetical protein